MDADLKTLELAQDASRRSMQHLVLPLGVPTHFRPTNENVSACGIVHPQYAAYDGRDVDCILCRKTKAWKTYVGQNVKGEASNLNQPLK